MRKPPANRILASLILAAAVAGQASAQPVCQQQIIEPPSPTFFYNFGMDVAIWGDTVVAGEPTISDFIAGRAHIFDYDEQNGWTHSQMLVPPDGQGGDRFGRYLSLESDILAVSADIQPLPGGGAGSIYVWRSINGTWFLEQKIEHPEAGTYFGRLVTMDDMRIASRGVSSAPSALTIYIFASDGRSWFLQQAVARPTPEDIGFGASIALDDDVLVVGAPFDSTPCPDAPPPGSSGLVFVYRWNGESWVEEQAIAVPVEPKCNRQFGRAVAVHGKTIVATARSPTEAFVFEYDENSATWVHTATVKSPEAGGGFGRRPRSAALVGDTLIVGDDVVRRAFVFQRRPDGAWIERAVLKPDGDGTYGWTVAIHSGRAIVRNSSANMGAGEAYIYDLEPKTGDLNCDGLVNVEDLLILLNSWGECPSTPYPGTDVLPPCNEDLNHDGHVGVQDLLILLQNWG